MAKRSFSKSYSIILVLAVIAMAAVIFVGRAEAATLYFSPSSGNFTVGNILTVNILVNTEGVAINNAEAIINFPSNLLEIVSVGKSGSIFSLWVEEPTFSNSAGILSFNGGLPTPGFNGTAGKVLGAVFRVKKEGSASLVFSSAAVRANDGYGTNVFKTGVQAFFNLISEEKPLPPPAAAIGTPEAPNISSPTHPDQDKWYSNSNPKFVWPVPSGVIAIRLLYDKYPNSQPRVVYEPAASEKEITDLKDGVYYFHAQFKNNKGCGAISHFRFQIDTQPPEPFSIKFVDGTETENPRPTAIFDTTDALSGIDYYKIKIGEGDFFGISPEIIKHNPYTLPLQSPGKRSILVQAFDRASNYTVATEEFVIKPISPPTITDYPKQLKEGDTLIIKGKTYPNSMVKLSLRQDDVAKSEFQEGRSDEKGEFTIIWDKKLTSDIYKFWAEVSNEKGAQSGPSDTYVISVTPAALLRIGSLVINYLTVVVSLLVILIALIFLGTYLWFRYKLFKRRLKKETIEAEKTLRSAFNVLSKNIICHIKLLEKTMSQRSLTEEEETIIAKCKEDLDHAKKLIGKEIEDIEKEMK